MPSVGLSPGLLWRLEDNRNSEANDREAEQVPRFPHQRPAHLCVNSWEWKSFRRTINRMWLMASGLRMARWTERSASTSRRSRYRCGKDNPDCSRSATPSPLFGHCLKSSKLRAVGMCKWADLETKKALFTNDQYDLQRFALNHRNHRNQFRCSDRNDKRRWPLTDKSSALEI